MDKLSTDDWIVAALALLLAIDLLFLPWFSITVGFGAVSLTATSTATGSPDGWLGILALLGSLALLADLLIDRLSPQTNLPAIGGSRSRTRLALAGATAVFVGLKFLFHIHFNYFGFGFWGAVVLAAALLFATLRQEQGQAIVPTR
jgi:hypothetical protein